MAEEVHGQLNSMYVMMHHCQSCFHSILLSLNAHLAFRFVSLSHHGFTAHWTILGAPHYKSSSRNATLPLIEMASARTLYVVYLLIFRTHTFAANTLLTRLVPVYTDCPDRQDPQYSSERAAVHRPECDAAAGHTRGGAAEAAGGTARCRSQAEGLLLM